MSNNSMEMPGSTQEKIITKEEAKIAFTQIREFIKNPDTEDRDNIFEQIKLAEKWLNGIKNDQEALAEQIEKDKGRNIDHRKSEIFKAYRLLGELDSAKSVIESMVETPHNQELNSKNGRLKVLSSEIEKN